VSTARVFRSVLGNRDLRRVELAFAGFTAAEYSVWIAMLVYAFRRGGATEASLVAALQLIPAAICAPFLALLADRHRPVRVLVGGYLAQGIGMSVTALTIATGAPVAVVYAGAVLAATAVTISRPAQAVIEPSLARSAEELTAANVVTSWVENGSVLVSSLLTGLLLAVWGVSLVFGIMAVVAIGSALLVAGVDGPNPTAQEDGGGGMAEVMAGFGALRMHADLRPLMGLLVGEFVLWGAMDVLVVVLAIDVLGVGDQWVGYLNAAFAVGGVVGGLAAVTLVGRRHLAPPIGIGVVLFGAGFVVIALWPSTLMAVLLLALSGTGRVLLDVSCRSLLQRTTPSEVLGRVFGLLEGVMMAGLALGSLLIPPLVSLGGSKTALIGAGLLMPVLAVVIARPLIAVDRGARVPVVEIALLHSMSLFAPLPAPALEGVARALEQVELPAGTVVITMGDEGDRFYAIAEGELEVRRDGKLLARLGRGAGFGEIALLEDVPRTATVTALTDVRLFALEKAPFVTAVTGHAPAAQAASAIVRTRRDELAQLTVDAEVVATPS
jgi:MFS family permease